MPVTIALDAMGGDHGPSVVVPAAADALAAHPGLSLILTGDEPTMRHALEGLPHDAARLSLRHTTEVVESNEPPSQAVRRKKDSSMRVAIDLVKEGSAAACVSAGNTGALMAIAKFVLKTLPGVDRPAICTTLPSLRGHTHMLDLGANVDSSAENLADFALMGSLLAEASDGISAPRVGLLNIGQEEIKGNERVKEAARLLETTAGINYIGFVEGDHIYMGDVDVVVCDGFVGNIALKTSEGLARLITRRLKDSFMASAYAKLTGLLAKPVLGSFRRHFDPRRYNGASLLGLNGIVVKSHGGADRVAFANAIGIALREAEQQLPALISRRLEERLSAQGAA
jgi:glycerol-3-phosphate acyltransferase PlsX